MIHISFPLWQFFSLFIFTHAHTHTHTHTHKYIYIYNWGKIYLSTKNGQMIGLRATRRQKPFYSCFHFQCLFIVKSVPMHFHREFISNAFLFILLPIIILLQKSFPMHFYSKNHFQCIFIVKSISNAFL